MKRFTFATAFALLAFPTACNQADFEVGASDPEIVVDAETDAGGETFIDASPDGAGDSADSDPGETVTTCTGQPEGALCGDGTIRRFCRGDSCVVSICGDKFVDPGGGEQCDDGNEESGDGCEPKTCKFSCAVDADCDDHLECTIGESCVLATHVCTKGKAATPGKACALPDGASGGCNGTTCAPPSCGNMVVDPGEQCDDGNPDDADGCKKDCHFTCTTAAECDDHNVCNGIETCSTEKHVCAKGTSKVCADGSSCTADACDPISGCKFALIDKDGDGVASSALGACGLDCDDGDPNAKPGQTSFFSVAHSGSFDWNCDGVIEREKSYALGYCYYDDAGFCMFKEGFSNTAPACGATKQYITACTLMGEGCYPVGPDITMRCR